jgi:hypothetical protein
MDAVSRQILTKFEIVNQLLNKLSHVIPSIDFKKAQNLEGPIYGLHTNSKCPTSGCPCGGIVDTTTLQNDLNNLYLHFTLTTTPLYNQASYGENIRNEARIEFQRLISVEDIEGNLDRLVLKAKRLFYSEIPKRGNKTSELRNISDMFKQLPECFEPITKRRRSRGDGELFGQPQWVITVNYCHCEECNVDMQIDSDSSELRCQKCGILRDLVGTVFDDAQFYNQEGQKAKSGTFNPNRHYRFWIEHILAMESEEELGDKNDAYNQCGEKLLMSMTNILHRDKKILQLLDVEDCRSMLKELGRTDLNKNVPLILKKLTGVGPPQLPESLRLRGEMIFSKAIEIRGRICQNGRVNRNYYPFYIYKIFDAILSKTDNENRRILYYIHLQGTETLFNNDSEWEEICEELPEIDWKPTDRTQVKRYKQK